jgi:hypothetical protein|nr:MAG TPA: 43 kDa tail protein [Caudoviricetes sp.]
MRFEITITNKEIMYYPVVEEGITWETERKGSPGKVTFKVYKDSVLNIEEGNSVSIKKDGENVFYGFIFLMKIDKDGFYNITAYDQLRYFKNKDTYYYVNKKANEILKELAVMFNLNVGTLDDTEYIIPKRLEEDKTLFDMVQNALDFTLQNKKKMYVLYDDFGKLTLKNIENMKLNILIDEETAENYSYTSSIDSNTYNQIKLTYDNEDTGKRDVYISKDTGNINKWGLLQYFEKIDDSVTNPQAKCDALLQLYNKKTKNLSISNIPGDVRVRAGTSVVVMLDLGDIKLQNYMLVEKAKHTFNESEHYMDLTLRGDVYFTDG